MVVTQSHGTDEHESDLAAEDRPCNTGTNDKSEPLDTAGDHQESMQETNGKLKNFIAGPIDLLWLKRAISLRRLAADVAMALRFKVGVTEDKFLKNRASSLAGRYELIRGFENSLISTSTPCLGVLKYSKKPD